MLSIKSNGYRLNEVEQIKKYFFKDPLIFYAGSKTLEITQLPVLQKRTRVTQIYFRQDTKTYLNELRYGERNIIVKIFATKGRPDYNGLLSDHQIEIRYLILIEKLMKENIADCGTLPIASYNASFEELKGSEYLTEAQKKVFKPARMYFVMFAEKVDGSLTDFLYRNCLPQNKNSDYTFMAAIFQSTFGLAIMHTIFPSFRHNDLHASNILVQNMDVQSLRKDLDLPNNFPLVIEYMLGNRIWQIDLEKSSGIRCLLWDMSFSSIDSRDAALLMLESVVPKETQFGSVVLLSKTVKNQYCDIYRLLDTIRWVLSQNGGSRYNSLSRSTKTFLDDIVPHDISTSDKSMTDEVKKQRQLLVHGNVQYASPVELLLATGYFDTFRVDNIPVHRRVRPIVRINSATHENSPVWDSI